MQRDADRPSRLRHHRRHDRADRERRRRLRAGSADTRSPSPPAPTPRATRPQTATASSTFSVVPPPRVDMLSLPGSHTGNTRSVGAAWTGVTAAGPYSTTWAWGDGTFTTCATGQSTLVVQLEHRRQRCRHVPGVAHLSRITERDAIVTVDGRHRAAGDRVDLVQQDHGDGRQAGPRHVGLVSVIIAPGGVGATLTTPAGAPIPGRTISFNAGNGHVLCTATTGADGKAAVRRPGHPAAGLPQRLLHGDLRRRLGLREGQHDGADAQAVLRATTEAAASGPGSAETLENSVTQLPALHPLVRLGGAVGQAVEREGLFEQGHGFRVACARSSSARARSRPPFIAATHAPTRRCAMTV